jgi:uncharacterized protein
LTKIQLASPHPALILQEKTDKALVVADLHIGWERLLTQKGVHLPSQTPKLKQQLLDLIAKTKPTHLIVLGDVKDAITNPPIEEWKDIPEFFETLQQQVSEIQVVLGNHDGNLEPLLPEKTKIVASSGTKFGDVGLFHGHAWPAPELLNCKSLVTAHVHPTVAIRDPMGLRITKQVFVKASCDSQKLAKALPKNSESQVSEVTQLFLLPSFNQFLGGRPINKPKKKKEAYIGPILRSGCVNMNEAEVYLVDGTFLGTVKQLKPLS